MTDTRRWPEKVDRLQGADAVLGLTVYILIGGEATNIESWEATDDPDTYADAVLREVAPEPSDGWRLTGGDDLGDGLTTYTYIREATVADIEAFESWADGPGAFESATPNGGLLTGPEEYGYIPGGRTISCDGMSWNVGGVTRIAAVDCHAWPITVPAAAYVFDGGRRLSRGLFPGKGE